MSDSTADPEEPGPGSRPYRSASKRVELDLRKRIGVGFWGSGTILPSRRQIAAEYGVDVNTLQRAMEPLIADKLLRVDIGRGTFVSVGATRPEAGMPALSAYEAHPVSTERKAPITLGIIAGQSLDTTERRRNADLWDYIIVHGLESEFAARAEMQSQYCSLAPLEGSVIPLSDAIVDVLASGADALALVLPMEGIEPEALLAAVRTVHVPLVVVTFQELRLPISHISYDGRLAAHQAARHLLQQGYRRLAFFGPFGADWVSERLEGVRDAVRLAGLAAQAFTVSPTDPGFDPLHGEQEEFAREAARHWMPKLISEKASGAVGVIAANDPVACGFMHAAADRGWSPGKDYGIVGFDDRPWARAIGLTSLHPPIEEMGREAARQLIRALAGEEIPMQVRLRSHLMPRKSSRRIPGNEQ